MVEGGRGRPKTGVKPVRVVIVSAEAAEKTQEFI